MKIIKKKKKKKKEKEKKKRKEENSTVNLTEKVKDEGKIKRKEIER